MFRSAQNLRLAADMRALQRVAAPWRKARSTWFDGTPESLEARLAATERVLTHARSGVTQAHIALEREASIARAELKEASHRLMVDFLDDGARAFKGSKRVADFDVEAAYYDDGADGLSEDQEGPRRFEMFPPGGDEINVGGYRYQHDPNTKQYLKVSPMGGLEGTPLEPGQEYSDGNFKPYYPDDWDGMSSDQEGPRRFDVRGLVNEEHPYHADEGGGLYGYDPVTQQHLKVSPVGGLEGTPEAPGQQYTDYLPERADRTKGGRSRSARRRVAGDGPGTFNNQTVDDMFARMDADRRYPEESRARANQGFLEEMAPEDRPGYGEHVGVDCRHCGETIHDYGNGYQHYDGVDMHTGDELPYDAGHPAVPDDPDYDDAGNIRDAAMRRRAAPMASPGDGGSAIAPVEMGGGASASIPGAIGKMMWNGSTMTGQEPRRNAALPGERGELSGEEPSTWDTEGLQRDFHVDGFSAPFVVVRRKSDGQKGSLEFSGGARHGTERVYHSFRPHEAPAAFNAGPGVTPKTSAASLPDFDDSLLFGD